MLLISERYGGETSLFGREFRLRDLRADGFLTTQHKVQLPLGQVPRTSLESYGYLNRGPVGLYELGDGKVHLRRRTPKTTFTAKDVKLVRESFELQFGKLARANPRKALAIVRVKERLSLRLAQVERRVAVVEKAGKKVSLAEGRAIVGKVVQDELADLDVDGDGRSDFSREAYDTIVENSFRIPLADPLSTFSIDVDTASFSNVRRFI
ncbi:MAG: von Willebrand factor type A domain-containing protein, partial [Planctomycetes bacterium]|nr:von Willebrand factor type A domain-containing protein [Planctomycetota bacterium]